MLGPGRDALGHTAHNQVRPPRLQQTLVEGCRNFLMRMQARIHFRQRRLHSSQELRKRQGIDTQQIDLPHRIGFRLSQICAQKAARCHNMVFIRLLMEILQGIECRRAFLHLIQDDQSLTGLDFEPIDKAQLFQQPTWSFCSLEQFAQRRILIKVAIDHIHIFLTGKLLHQPGLPDLTSALEDQRLPIWSFLPRFQVLHHTSQHIITAILHILSLICTYILHFYVNK